MGLTIDIEKAGYGKKVVLENIRFTAERGTFTAVIGPNGSGKSTLFSCIAGLLPYRGTITADGADLSRLSGRERALKIGVMLQQTRAPHIPVADLVAFGRAPYHSGLGDRLNKEDCAAVEKAIRAADLEELRHAFADRISGGEQRRVYFAMLLAQNTPYCLLDESTAFMDARHERRILSMASAMTAARNEKKTVLAVMHDLSAAVRTADRTVLLDGGRMIYAGSTAGLLETELIEKTFGVRRYIAEDENGEKALFFS